MSWSPQNFQKSFFDRRGNFQTKVKYLSLFSNTITKFFFSFFSILTSHRLFRNIWKKKLYLHTLKFFFQQVHVLCTIPIYPHVGCVRVFPSSIPSLEGLIWPSFGRTISRNIGQSEWRKQNSFWENMMHTFYSTNHFLQNILK